MNAGRRPSGPGVPRLSGSDLATLATDHGSVPMQVGAVLLLEEHSAPRAEELVAVLRRRTAHVPRLGERLRRPPWGCGRPYWEPAPSGDCAVVASAPAPADDAGLVGAAVDEVVRRLPQDRPLWRAVVYAGPDGRARGLVVVMHHVLADGIGGLAVLGRLVDPADGGRDEGDAGDPAPSGTAVAGTPSRGSLARDAWTQRWSALRSAPRILREAAAGLRELGGVPRPAASWGARASRTSLLQPTGPHRRAEVVEVDLAPVVAAAHAHDATVNDLLLVAVSGALRAVLAARGDPLDEVVVSVPVSARRSTSSTDLGNHVGVLPVAVPLAEDPAVRLAAIRDRRARLGTSAPRASSGAVLSALFRALARVGLFQLFVRRQRLVHTFLTNLRGPGEPLAVAGGRVRRLLPVATVPGNVTVSFDALSYAGRLAVCAVYDPGLVPDHDVLRRALEQELSGLHLPSPGGS